jgi:hypothetical protein
LTGGESRSHGDKPFGSSRDDEQGKKVREYAIHRVGEGAHLGDVAQERYGRRNAAQVETQESLDEPSMVEAAYARRRRPSPLRGLVNTASERHSVVRGGSA